MKKIIFFVFMVGFSFSQAGWSGHAEGNGGQTDTQDFIREFLDVTDLVIADLNSWAKDDFPEIAAEKLQELKSATKIYARTRIERNGEEVDAKNYSATELKPAFIEFSTVRWEAKNILEKKALVFHEFCGVAQLEENRDQFSDYNISAHYKDSLLERDRETEKFRERLRIHVRNVGEATLSILNPDTTVAVQKVQEIQNSDLYKTATNTRQKKHWWQSASVSKEEQIRATMELSEKLSVLAWMGDVQTKIEILKQRDQVFQDWELMIFEEYRKQIATESRTEVTNAFRAMSEELNQMHTESLDRMYQKCYSLPLGKSVECAFELLLNQLSYAFPQAIQERRVSFEKKLQDVLRKIGAYYE